MSAPREPGEWLIHTIIGALIATGLSIAAAAAMVWRDDAIGSAARLAVAVCASILIVLGQPQ